MNRQKHINTFQLDDDDVSESRQNISNYAGLINNY